MSAKLKKRIHDAISSINDEMSQATGIYGRGLASEGYAGGYRQALCDITLLLNGAEPNNDRGYWKERPKIKGKKA